MLKLTGTVLSSSDFQLTLPCLYREQLGSPAWSSISSAR